MTETFDPGPAQPEELAALEELATNAGRDLEDASAAEILQWARGTFGDQFAITASMADGVLSHVAGQAIPGVDVLFLDTGYHFAETLGHPRRGRGVVPVNVKTVGPSLLVHEHEADFNSSTRSTRTCAARSARCGRSSAPCGLHRVGRRRPPGRGARPGRHARRRPGTPGAAR